ncbi:hypothetical protein KCU98_g1560, partial [Aureobasidium melanogenum]
MAPASFSSLPPELVSKICSDPGLEKKDLIALRLTSKSQHIHASATKAFGKRYFRALRLLYTEDSLITGVKICQHPILGPCIRKVELSCARFVADMFYDEVIYVTNHFDSRDEFVWAIQRLRDRCDAEQKLDDDLAKTLLDEVFMQLTNSDHSIEFSVSTDGDRSLRWRKVETSNMNSEHWLADVPTTLNLLLGAASKHGCKVEKIKIRVEALRRFGESDLDLSGLLCSASELSLDAQLAPVDDFPDENGEAVWLIKKKNVHNHVVPVISALRLEEPHLGYVFRIYHDDLIKLLKRLRPTLRRLIISSRITGSWKEIFLFIRDMALQLDYLMIDCGVLPWLYEPKQYKGTTAVRLGLEELLQEEQDAA